MSRRPRLTPDGRGWYVGPWRLYRMQMVSPENSVVLDFWVWLRPSFYPDGSSDHVMGPWVEVN